jgi:16S rRNA G966 N2-methylase RsmD
MNDIKKTYISSQIKAITPDMVNIEMDQLITIGKNAHTISPRSRIGNNIVDFFTFKQRLETKGKYNTNFFEFLENIDEFKKKKYIQTMLSYYEKVKNKNKTKNDFIVYKEVYNICISAINIMRPLNCMEIYIKYHAKKILNFCAGWGGSTVAASALGLESHHGIDINHSLLEPYKNMIAYLATKSATKNHIHIGDAVLVDYSTLEYDTVFSSPPYYFIEKYSNNVNYTSKKDMNEKFYKPLFSKTYDGLQPGGHYIINICQEVYDTVLQKLLGEAIEIFPFKKSKRQNDYTEMVYVWKKAG